MYARSEELRTATLQGFPLHLSYRSESGRLTRRTVEPRQVFFGRSGVGYLKAFCRLRNEERTFRLDRILTFEPEFRRPAARPAPSEPFHVYKPSIDATSTCAAPAAAPAAPARPSEPPREEAPAAQRSSVGFGSIAACIAIFFFLASSPTPFGEFVRSLAQRSGPRPFPTIPHYVPAAAVVPLPAPALKPAPKPQPAPPKPAPVVRRLTHRGVQVVHTVNGAAQTWEAPGRGWRESSRRGLFLLINREAFRKATGIKNNALETLFAEADLDRDGLLDWSELEAFQRSAHGRYRYQANALALRPDEFVAAHGGDCEDWSILSCGLLRFWDWECYIGTLRPPAGGNGHAVALVRSGREVAGRESFKFDKPTNFGAASFPAGYYVPIDYQYVGALSEAVGSGWKLDDILVPEKIYGLRM